MAEQWEWEEVYIRFQTAVMDESTAKKKKNDGGRLHAFHCLKLSRRGACVELSFLFVCFFPTTIDVIGTMEHLEEEPVPTCPLLFSESVILRGESLHTSCRCTRIGAVCLSLPSSLLLLKPCNVSLTSAHLRTAPPYN